VARRCVAGIRANRETCERYANRSPAIATALNPLVGYARVAEIVKKALATGRTISEICLEEHVLPKQQLDRLLNPRRLAGPELEASRRRRRSNSPKRGA
jgi:aspartate ammonia-lyase